VNAPGIPATHFIGNAWRAPAGGDVLPMIDPSDGTQFATIARGTAQDVDAAVASTHTAFDLDADEVEAVVYGGTGR